MTVLDEIAIALSTRLIGADVLVEAATTRAEFVEHQSVVLGVVSHGRARP